MRRYPRLATRLLRRGDGRDHFAVPRGYIDEPVAGSSVGRGVVPVRGWCLFPGSSVARVEVTLDALPPQRARIAMPRPDLSPLTGHPAAPIGGFECLLRLTELPGSAGPTQVTAVAHAADGRALALDPVTIDVAPPVVEPEPEPPGSAREAELRARTARHVRPPVAGTDDGVRLLVFAHQLPYGGASLYLLELLRRLQRNPGFECAVVSLQDGPLRRDLEEMGIEVHLTDGFPVHGVERYEGNMAELVAWAAAGNFNVAFVNTLVAYSGADLAGRLGIPYVWAVHESFDLPMFWSTAFPPGTPHPYVARRTEHSLRSAAAVVFEAEATRRLFLPYAEEERLLTMPYGIELDDIRAARAATGRAELRRSLGIAEDARVLLCLGTIEARKSQAMLAEAFAAVAARHPDTVLALVGEVDAEWCGLYARAVREFAARTGLGERIRVEPVTAEPYAWHVASDFHVCASDIESLPRSILEAMAFEKPVISTDVFGVPEVIEDGVTGFLSEMRDSASLAAQLDRALSADPGELTRITRRAAERVALRHEPDGYAREVWNLLSALARDPNACVADIVAGGVRPAQPAPLT